jgi:RND superfamily putative drug exporter
VLVAQFMGFALGVAVLLDATIIRMVLVPAIMHIAGRWNWWPGVRLAPVTADGAVSDAEGSAEEPGERRGGRPSPSAVP